MIERWTSHCISRSQQLVISEHFVETIICDGTDAPKYILKSHRLHFWHNIKPLCCLVYLIRLYRHYIIGLIWLIVLESLACESPKQYIFLFCYRWFNQTTFSGQASKNDLSLAPLKKYTCPGTSINVEPCIGHSAF